MMIDEIVFRLTSGDFDQYDKIKPYAILNLFQEAAGTHANEIGVGYEEMLDQNYYWIITKNIFQILKNPGLNETVIVRTWPMTPGRADFNRCYELINQDGEVYAIGKGKWCVLDKDSRRIIRSDKINFNGKYIEKDVPLEFERSPLLEYSNMEKIYSYKVSNSSLDHYHHMNNAKYAEAIFDSIGESNIKCMQINNLNEAKLNETIDIYINKVDNRYDIVGVIDNEKLCFTAFVLV